MSAGKFVSYLRVSTDKQGRSGMGLEAQRAAVDAFLNGGQWELVAEFVEVETGKNDERPKLQEALHRAKVTGATLVIAKLDRLSRNVGFIAKLQDAKIKFVCADMPAADEMTIGFLAVVAQRERKMISERTRDAMQAAKARGRKFGNPNGARALRGLGNRPAVEAIHATADARAADILPIIEDIRAGGVSTLRGIAGELNARGILTARNGAWHAATVANVLRRVPAGG